MHHSNLHNRVYLCPRGNVFMQYILILNDLVEAEFLREILCILQ